MKVECNVCEGKGTISVSCCGNRMDGEIDTCPTCFALCDCEPEGCDECGGTGEITK